MTIIPITKEQAIQMLSCYHNGMDDKNLIDRWVKDGYIKKSALETAREYPKNYKDKELCSVDYLKGIKDMRVHYEAAIADILEERK